MASIRASVVRSILRHSVARKYRKAGTSVPALRELDDLIIRTQRLPGGTSVTPAAVAGVPCEWVQGPGAVRQGVVLFLHGGAMVSGSPAAHRETAARISAAAGRRVLSPDFRLAPEYPYPAALEDTLAVYQGLLEQGQAASGIAVGGESSGGGLALQALLAMREEGTSLPRAAFFFSPVTDWDRLDGESYSSRAALDPLISRSQCRFTASLYVGPNASNDPMFRPASMDLSGLPPLWVHVGDHEVLLSDSERLLQAAGEAGVRVSWTVWPGLWHGFQATAGWVPEARASIRDLGRFLGEELR